MPIGTQRAWLTEETYERARIELAELLTRRDAGSFVEHGDKEQCARRIRRLQELLGDAVVGYEPPDDGVAEPGMVLTVRYEADELIARFLMGEREEDTVDDLPVCSAQSPLGTALRGAKAGDRRTFSVPGRDVVTVSLVSAVPYRPDHRADRDERSFARRRLSSPQRSDSSGSSGGFHDSSRRSRNGHQPTDRGREGER